MRSQAEKSTVAAPSPPEIKVTSIDITYDAPAPNLLQWFAKLRVSAEGQAITKAVCEYYGVPPKVVDVSTEEFWQKQLQSSDAGNEHHGSLTSPPGYSICEAHRVGEVSITGPSTLAIAVVRKQSVGGLDGLGWYAAVPSPGLFAGGNWAKATWQVTFVKTDPAIWNKYKAKCSPANHVVPGHYVMEDCHGQSCSSTPYLLN